MSATGRNLPGAERHADDFYATPPWCVEALLRGSNLPSGRWLEPTAGDGAIVEEVLHHRIDVEWHLVESRAEELRVGGGLLSRLLRPLRRGAWQPTLQPGTGSDSARADDVVCSLHASAHQFLGFPEARCLDARAHAVYVLPKRPSFTGGKTDATEYAWFCWDGKPSRVVIL